MTTAVVVQARVGSSRLPGKVLETIGVRTVLEEVLRRCWLIPGADAVICAIPDKPQDDVLINLAERAGAVVVRGSETDVLSRYATAATFVSATEVMRVTSDCPLIDPDVCGAVLQLRERHAADYASNILERSFPTGLDCEAFTAAALFEAAAKASEPNDREHVTEWLIRAPHLKRVNLHSGKPALAQLRWTLDYPEDLAFMRAVFAELASNSRGDMSDVLSIIDRDRAITEINIHLGVE